MIVSWSRLSSLVADFTQQLSEIHDRHSEDLQVLVEAFRKRNAEIRKERTPYQSTLFSLWEMLLQEVEAESHSFGEMSRFLSRNLGNGLLEKTFHKKIQSRKAFLHRESVEAILNKANEALETVRYTFLLLWISFMHKGSAKGRKVLHIRQQAQHSDWNQRPCDLSLTLSARTADEWIRYECWITFGDLVS